MLHFPPRQHWAPDEPSWAGIARLVRPYVMPSSHPEQVPDAPRPEFAGRSDCCPSVPQLILWSVPVIHARAPWGDFTGTAVRELQLCGHHADVHEPVMDDWVVVLDARQRTRDLALRAS
jgi:hypothetical protein